ncbi:regulation of nuclear pre-mRNA domain-containing protein 2 isoform X2 [Danaus plexippus]|uniref:regulation of nuclear pre-mRNA domain-containing protein 2 isoform X2 n=1 Tax=Danaus plexippus TaxID=13037 RepID=UPI002AB1967D|nr:regulation of nuclear pre-mRNA domain-containing protein 2 isoform X2 [Danaus plexippus]
MGETEEFNTLAFEKKLTQLKDTQESIQSLSSWCLKQRTHHKKIVSSWLNVLKRVKVEQRLVLFYLANDVIQYSKRKNYEFVESWGLNLQKATPLVRDEKVRPKILRIFKIWEQRSVYDDEFLSDLTGLLSAGAVKKTDDDPLDFQPQQLVNKIKQCTVLEADTQVKLKCICNSPLELSDTDALCSNLKERSSKDDVEKELNEGIQCVERYTQALQREIVAREALLALLSSANQYYSTQRGEVKVVAYAYKNFGSRVRALKRKLDELLPTLPSAPSPPTRDEDVPSPGPDEDLELPTNENEVSYNIDQTFNTSVSADGSLYNLGLSSFLNENSMAIFNESQADLNIVNSSIQPDTLPGLDLLKESNPPPPTSFYGTMETITIPDEPDQPYLPEAVVTNSQWANNTWNVPLPVARNVFAEPPASPPVPIRTDTQDISASDHELRSRLPPPPPPPVLPGLTHIEDVDHRLLPSLPPTPVPPPIRHSHQDVDHRNLISLTQLPPRHVNVDQDYRLPPLSQPLGVPLLPPPPSDIVESVDMDLSEDEERMYQTQNQSDHRHNSFNNNKVLVGGEKKDNSNLIQINANIDIEAPHGTPVAPMTNPFDNMPPQLRYNFNTNYQKNPDNAEYNDDIRNRNLDRRNQSPEYEDYKSNDFQAPRPYMNRFPRNWGPRNNFRAPYNQFNQRNGGPRQRWGGPRQRFW